jgi:hypothetical protein
MIYLASYKSTQCGWFGCINRGIRWVTRSIYSHTEVVAAVARYKDPWRFSPADFHITVDARNK